jgi:predicted AlkP superfamily pyrophosphatase or phosphodiesterase
MAALAVAAAGLLPPSPVAAQSTPKLVVLLVVDQMRADYVDRFGADWTGGFKRLLTDGAWFRRTAYPYFMTVTCAGHATIATGTFPHTHGIIQNEWADRNRRSAPWCVDDPLVSDIGYGVPPESGHGPRQLLVPTLADQLRARRAAHVVSLSLKADAAIMLAGHGGDAVTWANGSLSGWATSSAYAQMPVAQVASFVAANRIDAYFKRVWDRLLPIAKYTDPDAGVGEGPPPGWSAVFPHPLSGRGSTPDLDYRVQWLHSPYVDDYLGRFAAALVESMRLGRREGTDVLAISFSATDEVGHLFGPRSQEVQDTLARLDRTLGALFERLDALVGREQYVIALTADHGVTAIPEQARREGRDAGRLDPDEIVDRVEARLNAVWGRGRYVAGLSGSNMNMYFVPGMYDRLRASPAILESVVQTIQQVNGISRVFKAEDVRYATGVQDSLTRAVALSYYPERSGDLLLVMRPGWNMTTTPAMHGSATADDQNVPLFLMGPGVKPGQYQQASTPADVAPTLAALVGLTLPGVEGRVLREALK